MPNERKAEPKLNKIHYQKVHKCMLPAPQCDRGVRSIRPPSTEHRKPAPKWLRRQCAPKAGPDWGGLSRETGTGPDLKCFTCVFCFGPSDPSDASSAPGCSQSTERAGALGSTARGLQNWMIMHMWLCTVHGSWNEI